MEQCFFSVVIPVYDGLKHSLPMCLDSIWNQPLDHSLYEVICVDDCSKDDTRGWLRKQMKLHPNLKVIENERNLRQGGSRNKGVKAAKGKYIVFIDQDDYFADNVFSKVHEHLKTFDIEILIGDCSWIYEGKEKTNKLQHNFPFTDMAPGDEVIAKNNIPWAPWKFIFLRSLVLSNHLFFEEHERIEDVDWCYKLVHAARKVQYQPLLLIYYNKNLISTTMTAFESPETIYSTLRMGYRLFDLYNGIFADVPELARRNVLQASTVFYSIAIRNFLFFSDTVSKKEKALKECLKGDQFCGNKLIHIAVLHPKLFAILSNIVSPFSRFLLRCYRKVKY